MGEKHSQRDDVGKKKITQSFPSPNMRFYLCGKLKSFVPKLVVEFFFFFLIHDAGKQPQYAVDSHPLWKYCLMSTGNKGFILHFAV